jgi:uncharacterized lipoprotein YddW (UPF0748 family)
MLMDRDKRQQAIEQLVNLNFNAIYPVVWNSGYALYPSAIAQREGIQPFVPTGAQGQEYLGRIGRTNPRTGDYWSFLGLNSDLWPLPPQN